MTRAFLFIFIVLVSMFSYADRYKILFMNYPTLLINGKAVKVGYVFDDNAVVRWSKERQAMRVFNLDKKKQILMVAHAVDPKGNSISDILTANKHLSTHSSSLKTSPNVLRLLSSMFEKQYDLMDTIVVNSPISLSENKYFQASYYYGDSRITKRLSSNGNDVYIDRTLFNIDGRQLEPRDVTIDIDFIDETNSTYAFVCAGVEIFVVPEKF